MRILLRLLSVVWMVGAFEGACMGDPVVPKNCLYKPTFLLLDDSWTAGTAFLIRVEGQTGIFLITANHLFGPDAGLPKQMSPDDIASQVKGVAALSMQDLSKNVWFPNFKRIADADSIENRKLAKDLAVFTASDIPNLEVLELANTMPKRGEKVWVFARQRGDTTPALCPATVDQSDSDQLTYFFDNSHYRLPGTSGAPVLNGQGKVVGMNLGGGITPDQQFMGCANPIVAIRSELASVLKH